MDLIRGKTANFAVHSQYLKTDFAFTSYSQSSHQPLFVIVQWLMFLAKTVSESGLEMNYICDSTGNATSITDNIGKTVTSTNEN